MSLHYTCKKQTVARKHFCVLNWCDKTRKHSDMRTGRHDVRVKLLKPTSNPVDYIVSSDAVSTLSCGAKTLVDKHILEEPSDPSDVINKSVITFEVCGPNKYKAEEKLQELKTSGSATASDIFDAQTKADEEHIHNARINESQQGRKVYYGQTIQLRCVSTQKYVDCSRRQDLHTPLNTVNLNERNGSAVQFKFAQSMSNDISSTMVEVGDSVTVERVENSEQYLHLVTDSIVPAHGRCGIEISSRASEFRISRIYRPTASSAEEFHTGEIIQIHHKQLEADLVAESSGSKQAEVYLQKSSHVSNGSVQEGRTCQFQSFWQIDIVKSNDGVMQNDNSCRFLHVSTQKFLCLNDGDKFDLSADKSDRRTLFKLQSASPNSSKVLNDSLINLQCMEGKGWLYPSQETFERNKFDLGKESTFLGTSVRAERLQCRMVHSTKSKHEVDTFKITKVTFPTTIKDICFVQELCTRTKAYLQNIKGINQKGGHQETFLLENIVEVKKKLSPCDTGVLPAQQQLRNFIVESGLLKQLFQLMELQSTSKDQTTKKCLYTGAADLIASCLEGLTGDNKSCNVGYLDFCIQESRNQQSPMNQKALAIMVEMFKDNVTLVGLIKEHHIDKLFEMFKMDKNYLYFKLLEAVCVCNGDAIMKNQIYITNKLIAGDDSQDLFYLSYMGEQIGLKEKKVYISINNGKPWIELQDVNKNDNIRLHYHYQLVFFKVLCSGRNSQSVQLLTTKLGFLTFDQLRWSMMDDSVCPENRTIYCQLLTVMFIEANKEPVFGKVPPYYDLMNLEQQQFQIPDSQMDKVILWSNGIIADNAVLVASNNEKNIFLAAILDVVQSLLLFGYYGNNKHAYDKCLSGVMKMLEGWTDKPSEDIPGSTDLKIFQEKERFRLNEGCPGLLKAKIRVEVHNLWMCMNALNVIELSLDKAIPLAIIDFIKMFKEEADVGQNGCEVKHLPQMPFQNSIELQHILLDLAKYENVELVHRFLSIMNKKFTMQERLFDTARVVLILSSDAGKHDMKAIHTAVTSLKHMFQSQDDVSQNEELCKTVQDLEGQCTVRGYGPHHLNQMLIFNMGLLELIFQHIKRNSVSGDAVFILMKSMTRGNQHVQRFMFNHLDILLNIEEMRPVIVEMIIEIFRGNKELCMMITPNHVKLAVALLAKWKLQAFIDLLHIIVRPHPGCILKRNKHLAISNLPIYWQDIFQHLDNLDSDHSGLWKDGQHTPHSEYILSLLDFMATCAEGENSFREAFCSRISQNAVQDILASSLTMSIKGTYLRFFTSVYVPVERKQLLHNQLTWNLIRSFDNVFELVKTNASKDGGLIPRSSSSTALKSLTMKMEDSSAIYLLEGIFPFLKAMFCENGSTITEQYQSDLDNLDSALQTFATDIRPSISEAQHFITMLKDVLIVVHRLATADEDDMNFNNIMKSLEKDVLPHNEHIHEQKNDDELNKRFQSFTDEFHQIYQNGCSVTDRVKDNLTQEQPWNLLQTDEFKSLVRCFMKDDGKNVAERFSTTSTICKYLMNSHKLSQRKNIELNIKCFQVLRSLLHEEIVQLPPDHYHKQRECERHLSKIKELQNILAEFGCVDCVFSHLDQGEGQSNVTGQAMALLADLLFNRNEIVQACILTYVSCHSTDKFFHSLHQILHQGIEQYKERKLYWTSATKNMEITQTGHGSDVQKPLMRRNQVAPQKSKRDTEWNRAFDARAKLTMAARMLGNIGNSQHEELKNLLRSQPLNSHSYNLVAECTLLMNTLYPQLDVDSVQLYINIVRTLTTLVSGNSENQMTIVDGNGMDAINHILITREFSNCSMSQILELKQVTIMLARSMIEMNHGSQSRHSELPKLVSEQIETVSLVCEIKIMWKSSQRSWKIAKEEQIIKTKTSKDKTILKELCCQYFLLLSRKIDLIPTSSHRGLWENEEDNAIFRSLETKTASVELIKDGILQKHYFTTDGQGKPSRQFKQMFHEIVDRSTPSTKLQDLVSWSSDYAGQALLKKQINDYLVGKIFIKAWIPMQVMLCLLTLSLVIFISVARTDPRFEFHKSKDSAYTPKHGDVVVYVLGGIHNFISGLIFVHFLITESPTILAFNHLGSIRKTTIVEPFKTSGNWSYVFNKYQLEVNPFNIKSIYYTLLLLCSLAGTSINEYFFAYHLFHLVACSTKLQKLFRVVQTGWRFLAMLGLLVLAIVYVYAILIYLFFRDYWDGSLNERHTYNLFQCLISLLHHGLIERTSHGDTTIKNELGYTVFDLGFFLMVTILCLYLALGIILDSFAVIRNRQEIASIDDRNRCFICNQESVQFEQGYNYHIKKEHNLWNYMVFLFNLDHCNPAFMTGLENFVLQKLKKKEHDFFPYRKSMPLDCVLSDLHLGEKMHQIELRMADIVSRLFKESEIRPGSFRSKESVWK